MSITDLQFRLPEDVDGIPDADADEVTVTRRGSRIPPKVLSGEAWSLLERFRTPSTLSAAILSHCAERGGEPMATLEAAFPVLVALTHSELLVPDGSDAAAVLTPRHVAAEQVGPATLLAPLRILRDGELWHGRLADGSPVVVKVVADPASGTDLFLRETTALRRLAGGPVPGLMWCRPAPDGGTMVLGFADGDPVDLAALDPAGARDATVAITVALTTLDAYRCVHDLGVLHGDVHPGNVLADDQGRVTLLDFGIADVAASDLGPAPRSSGGEQLDPVAASALRSGEQVPNLDLAAEIYSLAALAYRIITGSAPLDLDLERLDALDAITSQPPRTFADVGCPPWLAVERILARGLAKDPAERPADVREFRDALAAAAAAPHPAPVVSTPLPDDQDNGDWGDWERSDWDIGSNLWMTADATTAAETTATLSAIAVATGDVDAHDLALLWGVRTGMRSGARLETL